MLMHVGTDQHQETTRKREFLDSMRTCCSSSFLCSLPHNAPQSQPEITIKVRQKHTKSSEFLDHEDQHERSLQDV